MDKLKTNIPNVLTFINLSLGVIAILLAMDATNRVNLVYATLVILTAAVTDRFDGKVARMLGVQSELGKELDSLSDLISFGVAPVIVAWQVSLISLPIFGYLLVLIFPIAGAYRLARFNVTTTSTSNMFQGVPITIAGAFLCLINLFALNNNWPTFNNSLLIGFFIVALSFLMVSKFSIKKR